jgi:hypothetical protein
MRRDSHKKRIVDNVVRCLLDVDLRENDRCPGCFKRRPPHEYCSCLAVNLCQKCYHRYHKIDYDLPCNSTSI